MKKLFNPYLLLVALLALLAILQPATTYAAPAARPLFAPTTPVIPGLTLTKVGNGTVTVNPNQSTFDYGQTVTINAVPDSGWKLAGFSGDTAPRIPWWNAAWDFRTTIQVGAQGFERTNKPAEVAIDFTSLFANAGQSGSLDLNSLRLVEVNLAGNVLNDNVAYQFDKVSTFNAATKAQGTLVFMLNGTTQANSGRLFQLYFDRTGKSFTAPTFSPQIVLTTIAVDEGESSFKIEIPRATLYFHKAGGGFSSMDDIDGDDWLNYKKNGAGAAGVFRGLPNMIHPEGRFHPGASGTSSVIEQQGPLKLSMRATTNINGSAWEALWEIYPDYIKMTVIKAGKDYWYLYEGTPGGFLESNDFATLSTGQKLNHNQEWNGDLPNNEWAYFSDPNSGSTGRSFFVAKHEDDVQPDSYRMLGNADPMTVWGFGRKTSTESHFLLATALPAHFTFGLIDTTTFNAASKSIFGAYKDLAVTVGSTETRTPEPPVTGNSSPLTLAMVMNRNITVTFVKSVYSVTVNQVDDEGQPNTAGGTVTVTPSKPEGYLVGDQVTLSATTNPGWTFQGYSGSVTSSNASTQLTIDADEVVTATFSQQHYVVNVNVVDQDGQPITNGPAVTASLPADPDGYVLNETTTLQAVTRPGWTFVGWSGDLSGNESSKSLTFTGNKNVTATFQRSYYGLTLNAVDEAGTPITNGPSVNVSAPTDARGYVHGESATLNVVNQPGWTFLGWSGALSGSEESKTLTFDGAKSVTATFRQEHYGLTLNVVDNEGTPIVDGPVVNVTAPADAAGYVFGETATFSVPVTPGWTFLGWSGDLNGNENSKALTFDGDKSVTATFEQEHYTISVAVVDDKGAAADAADVTITPPAATAGYIYGEEVTITLAPKTSWNFFSWADGLSGNENPITFTVTGNLALKAVFTQGFTLSIRYNDSAGGTAIPNPVGPYQPGQVVQLTVVANPGWQFTGWSNGLTGNANPASITMDANKTVRANFAPIEYTLNLPAGTNFRGSVSADPVKTVYAFGDEVTLTATPNPNWKFSGWTITPTPSGVDLSKSTIKITIGANVTVEANFSEVLANSVFLPLITK